MKRLFLSTMVMVAALAWAGCDESLSSITGPTPNLEPSFVEHPDQYLQHERFERPAGLHPVSYRRGPSVPLGGWCSSKVARTSSLSGARAQSKPSATRVIPNDPDNSYMVQKLEGAAGIVGERMPQGQGPFLTEGQMIVIRQWIKDGAPNN